jgi:hypothetical protein
MTNAVIIDGEKYRTRRGKLVLIPKEWAGNITTSKTIRQRKSKLRTHKLRRADVCSPSSGSTQRKRGLKWVDRKVPEIDLDA